MKVALITPWDNAWVPYFKRAIEARGHTFALEKKLSPEFPRIGLFDVVIHCWTENVVIVPDARNIVFLRRYELFTGAIQRVDWNRVDALICVNTWIAEHARAYLKEHGYTTPVYVIYNGTDLDKWKYRERKAGPRIGIACHVHPKKNLPLALQVLALLPEHYELHIAGGVQDSCTFHYLDHMGAAMRRRVVLYHHIEHDQLSDWWEMMNFCLSTSISEGNPNNVIEAMAKGIKPIVHEWPGAIDQFPVNTLFRTAHVAASEIMNGFYDSHAYRTWVAEKFSLANIDQAVDVALNFNINLEAINERVNNG